MGRNAHRGGFARHRIQRTPDAVVATHELASNQLPDSEATMTDKGTTMADLDFAPRDILITSRAGMRAGKTSVPGR